MKARIILLIFLFLNLVLSVHGQTEIEPQKRSSLSLDSPVRLIDVTPSGVFHLNIATGASESSLQDMELSLFLVSGNMLSPLQSSILPKDEAISGDADYQIRLDQLPTRPIRVLAWLKRAAGTETIDYKFWIHLFPDNQLSVTRNKVPADLMVEFVGEGNSALEVLIHDLLPDLAELSSTVQKANEQQPQGSIRFEISDSGIIKVCLVESGELGVEPLNLSKQVLFQGRVELFLRNPNIQSDFLDKVVATLPSN